MKNSKGQRFFGMHFYPGVAEYAEEGRDPYRVFLNEDTIRKMGPTFEGRPVYVMHVDGVEEKLDELRKEVDGWVVRSFYNEADGKHWCEFIAVSEKALRAIKSGMRLSNCYVPKSFAKGGLWNGVSYAKEITGGEYEHLAIVPNPRYEESVILTPDEFKKYNADKAVDLKRFSNTIGKGDEMKVKLFKRKEEKIENDLDDMLVQLPKSKREVSLTALVNEADEAEGLKGKPRVVNASDMVEVDGEEMTVEALIEEVTEFRNAKKCNKEDEEKEKKENEDDMDDEMMNEDDKEDKKENEEDEAKEEKEDKKKNKKKKNSSEETEEEKTARLDKADRLKNAHMKPATEDVVFDSSDRQLARGKERYG